MALNEHAAVDGQPASVEGLYLVRHCDVGVQVRVAGPAVPVGERDGNQASNVDLPDPLRAGPGEQGMLLDKRQSILHGCLVGPVNHSRHRRIGDRPQRRHRLHRRKRQVIPSNGLRPRPRVLRDLSRQLPSINRLPAVLGPEKLAAHLGPHPRPISSRQRRARRQAGRRLDRRNAPGHLEPKRADDTINDLERHPQLGHLPEVTFGEVRSFKLLLAELGQRMQTAAEQRSHLLGGHPIADGQAIDPIQA